MANEIRSLANIVYADGPSNDPSNPRKDGPEGVRALFGLVEDRINSTDNDADAKVAAEEQARIAGDEAERQAREAAVDDLSDRLDLIDLGVTVSYETRTELYSDLAHPADTIGHVVGDSTEAYRGVYKKSGASGSGSWARIGPLPMVTNAASATVSGLMTPEMFNNLDRSYKPRGGLLANANLNTIIEPGVYFGTAQATMTGLPPELATGTAFYLIVFPYGWEQGSGPNNRYVPQTIENVANRFISFKRRLDQANPDATTGASAWQASSGAWHGTRQNVSINTLTLDGKYTTLGGMTDMPTGWSGNGLLSVEVFGGQAGFVLQTLRSASAALPVYQRLVRPSASQFPAWSIAGGGGSSKFASKSIVCFGDSLTEGNSSYRYPTLLASKLGAFVTNGGFGGCWMSQHTGQASSAYYDPMCMHALANRVFADDWSVLVDAADDLYAHNADDNRPQASALANLNWSSVDYGIIAFGTNDFSGSVPLGSSGDTAVTTFNGAINYTLDRVLTARPNMKLMFVTPMWRSRVFVNGDDSNVTPNGLGVFLREYCDTLIDRAEAFQIPVLDLYRESSVNILNWEHFMPDGLHPSTEAGANLLADKIAAGLERFY